MGHPVLQNTSVKLISISPLLSTIFCGAPTRDFTPIFQKHANLTVKLGERYIKTTTRSDGWIGQRAVNGFNVFEPVSSGTTSNISSRTGTRNPKHGFQVLEVPWKIMGLRQVE